MLPTAKVRIQGPTGSVISVRALLDPCSEVSLAPVKLIRRLEAACEKVSVNVSGIGGESLNKARGRTHLYLLTQENSQPIPLEVYVLQRLGITTPSSRVGFDSIKYVKNLDLADKQFWVPQEIDLLIGANAYSQLLKPGLKCYGNIVAQQTIIGWIITGTPMSTNSMGKRNSAFSCALTQEMDETKWQDKLLHSIQRFWEIEEIPKSFRVSPDDAECERIFLQHYRDSTGRYVVRLPFKPGGHKLIGDSLKYALTTLSSMHYRMRRDPDLAKEYSNFMKDYLDLGHMRALSSEELKQDNQQIHYIPHHGIWQRGDLKKKLRVVFNASRATSSGFSLNDAMYAGPKLLNNLLSVLTRWRRHKVAFCADIRMMFRQIRINEQDVNWQRIVWSRSPNEPIVHYQLLTVTYGENCSPYLSLRTLEQLCQDEGKSFPEAVKIILNDKYADDFLSGADDENTAKQLRDQLIKIMKAGGFELRKWVANIPTLLEDLPEYERLRPTWLQLGADGPVSELGVAWDPISDNFRFAPPVIDTTNPTKRKVLAGIAKLYDPCGWLSPIVLLAKQLMQDLWRAKLEWDEVLPSSMAHRWKTFAANLNQISNISIPRWIGSKSFSKIELHVFSDASRRAMAAVIYARVINEDGSVNITLLASKTKLVSINSLKPSSKPEPRMTIPRLELRAGLIAARLLRFVASDLSVPIDQCYAWNDAQIILRWLRSTEPIGNVLVEGYVNQIQELLPINIWHYVPTETNPADIASRGKEVIDLIQLQDWWNGPKWLSYSRNLWPTEAELKNEYQAKRFESTAISCLTQAHATEARLLERFSDLNKLLRFVTRLRRWLRKKFRRVPSGPNVLDPLSALELEESFLVCAKLSQDNYLSEEKKILKKGDNLPNRSSLKGLDVFLDPQGLIRVGGRLQHSRLSYNEKHPVLISGKCPLAKLIISWAHNKALHGGFRLTHSYVLRRAWIIGGNVKTKDFLRKCIPCMRIQARPKAQFMAPLPEARVTPARAFSRTGVDYAGPFDILSAKGRGIRSSKGYIALFVCLSTKAIHLELVGDLTTESFLGALTRFVGRRGKPAEIWSDNATNFRKADLDLQEALRKAEIDWNLVTGTLAEQGIKWHFIPPSAPHFGGLWEAGVKSVKTHLKRIGGTRKLTYEEFSTLLVSIEMVLNCRPLVPLSNDLSDLNVLTPGHFLVADGYTSIPEPSHANEKLDRLTHWNLVRAMRDSFWKRWSLEYINTLQQRNKWTQRRTNIQAGDIVLIQDSTLIRSNGRWPIGRITKAHPGSDGLTRVATVKTYTGEYVRPLVKLASLPIETIPLANSSTSSSTSTNSKASDMAGG